MVGERGLRLCAMGQSFMGRGYSVFSIGDEGLRISGRRRMNILRQSPSAVFRCTDRT